MVLMNLYMPDHKGGSQSPDVSERPRGQIMSFLPVYPYTAASVLRSSTVLVLYYFTKS